MNTEDKQPKDDFVYYNDEWNGSLIDKPEKQSYQWIDVKAWKYEQLFQGKITLAEYLEFIYKETKLIKNNKPDGRRYKK